MITKDKLNQDQRMSFFQMTQSGGFSEEESLKLIQELCIDKGYTGLRSTKCFLTTEDMKVAKELAEE